MTVAWLVLVLAAPPPPAPACVQAAIEQHRIRAFMLAARTAETCWGQTQDLRALLVACQARTRLGHFAEAASILARYDARATTDTSAWSRDSAEALRTEIAGHLGAVHLLLSPPLAAGERVDFELARPEDPTREPLRGGSAELERSRVSGIALDAGRWLLTLHREHFEPTRSELVVPARSAQTITVTSRRLVTPRTVALAASPTHLRLGPTRALGRGVELRLRRLDDDSETIRTQYDDTLVLHLAPGRWSLLARARGYAPLRIPVTPGAPVSLQLRRRSP